MGGDSGQVDPPRQQIDPEEDAQRLQPDGLDSEEVGGDDTGGLGAEEV